MQIGDEDRTWSKHLSERKKRGMKRNGDIFREGSREKLRGMEWVVDWKEGWRGRDGQRDRERDEERWRQMERESDGDRRNGEIMWENERVRGRWTVKRERTVEKEKENKKIESLGPSMVWTHWLWSNHSGRHTRTTNQVTGDGSCDRLGSKIVNNSDFQSTIIQNPVLMFFFEWTIQNHTENISSLLQNGTKWGGGCFVHSQRNRIEKSYNNCSSF